MPRRFTRSLRHALQGFAYAWREERNFKIQIVLAVVACAVMAFVGFTAIEVSLVVLAIAAVLGAEMINTFMEDLLDVLQPHRDPRVAKVKDLLAGIVLLMSLSAAAVVALVVLHHVL